jgi:SAM-dependent methyltransferase
MRHPDRSSPNGGERRVNESAATTAAAASFELSAAVYDELLAHNLAGARRLAAALPDGAHADVLDVGCGTGFASVAMLERFPVRRLEAVDPAAAMIARLGEKLADRSDLDLRLHVADVHTMPVAPASFDAVVSSMAFHWFPAKERAMATMAAALRPGGALGLLTAGRGCEAELREIMAAMPGLPDSWHAVFDLIHRDERDLEDLLEGAGLEVVDVWMERRRRRLPAQAYLDRIRATSWHVSQDMDPAEAEAHWERVSAAVHAAAGDRGFEYTFAKTFGVARRS